MPGGANAYPAYRTIPHPIGPVSVSATGRCSGQLHQLNLSRGTRHQPLQVIN